MLAGIALAAGGIYFLVPGRGPIPAVREAVPSQARGSLRPERPRYPYSVIPGGVYSDTEVRTALRSDPVAARHYAGFFQGGVHATVLSRPLVRYVSFRQNDQIYWTRKPVTLRSGETLLTDGNHSARARCGNQISETPQLPVLADDPPPETWEKPIEDPAAGGWVGAPPPSSDPTPALPPRVVPEVFVAANLVGLAVASPAPNSAAPFLWAGGRTGGLIPFNPTAPSSGTLSVNVPDSRPNPTEARPVAVPPVAPPAPIVEPPVILFAGTPPSAPRPPHPHPLPPTLEVPVTPSNPPAPPQPPTDGPPPSDPPGPPSDPPLPPVVPPTGPPDEPAPVPEPAVYLLVGFGLLLLGACRSVR